MSAKSFNWKPLLIAVGVLAAIFLLATGHIKSQKEFKVVHFEEVKSVVGSDGRAAVGSPEVYQIQISPDLTWDLSKNYTGVWRSLAWVVLILLGAFIGLQSMDTFDLGKSGSTHLSYVGLVVAAALYLAAYSSAFVSNYKEVDKSTYEQIKDDPEAMTELFKASPIIR